MKKNIPLQKIIIPVFLVLAVFTAVINLKQAHAQMSVYETALADPARPEQDKARDADRKPGAFLDFAGVKPGQKVVDLLPGKGYFTRILAKIVGPQGKVYSFLDEENQDFRTAMAAYPNVVVVVGALNTFKTPEPVDLVLTVANYHDLKNPDMETDTALFNKAVFDSLKSGGIFLVADNAALPGTGISQTNTLHRIDPIIVMTDVKAAGFKADAESDLLARQTDPHTQRSKELGDKVDSFVMRFKKP